VDLGYIAPEGEWPTAMVNQSNETAPSPKLQSVFGLDNPQNYRFFGGAVAMHHNTIVVGASTKDIYMSKQPTDETTIVEGGAAHVYKRSGPGGNWHLDFTVLPESPQPKDYFGSSVAIQHTTVVVGARGRAHGEMTNAGSVFVFTEECASGTYRKSCEWVLQAELTAPYSDMHSQMYFGQYVAFQDDIIAVGVPHASHNTTSAAETGGAVYLYRRVDTDWELGTKLTPPTPQTYDFFGAAIALVCDTLLVGAYGMDIGDAVDAGAAYVYTRRGDKWPALEGESAYANSSWLLHSTLLPPTDQSRCFFGKSVSVGSEALDCKQRLSLVVGAPSEDIDDIADAGAVYMFRWDEAAAAWMGEAKLLAPEVEAKNYFGSIVASAGDRVLVGAPSQGEASGEGTDKDNSTASGVVKGFLGQATVHLFSSERDASDDPGNWVSFLRHGTTTLGRGTTPPSKAVGLHSWREEMLMRRTHSGEKFTWKHDYLINDPDTVGSMFASSAAVDLNSLTFAVGAPARAGPDSKSPFSGALYIYHEAKEYHYHDSHGCQGDNLGCWPFAMVLGAPKAGTTSLTVSMQSDNRTCGPVPGQGRYHADALLPTLYSEYDSKEPHMLDRPISTALMRDPALYTRLFQPDECPSGNYIDWTPNYLIDWAAPERLAGLAPSSWLPQMKFISLAREPIARDLSWFNHLKRERDWPFCSPMPDGNGAGQSPLYADEARCNLEAINKCLHFESGVTGLLARYDACMRHPRLLGWGLNSLGAGLYAAHIERWQKFVSPYQFMILNFDSLIAKSHEHWRAIFLFLGLPDASDRAFLAEVNTACNAASSAMDQYYVDKFFSDSANWPIGTIPCDVRVELEDFFAPWNDLLVEKLDARRTKGEAPEYEPHFLPFVRSIECEAYEQPTDCVQELNITLPPPPPLPPPDPSPPPASPPSPIPSPEYVDPFWNPDGTYANGNTDHPTTANENKTYADGDDEDFDWFSTGYVSEPTHQNSYDTVDNSYRGGSGGSGDTGGATGGTADAWPPLAGKLDRDTFAKFQDSGGGGGVLSEGSDDNALADALLKFSTDLRDEPHDEQLTAYGAVQQSAEHSLQPERLSIIPRTQEQGKYM